MVVVTAVSSAAFIGLGLPAAVLPVFSPERGAEASNIFQGILLLVSGVYYPVGFCRAGCSRSRSSRPQPALSASSKLIGIGDGGETLACAPLSACTYELTVLTLMGR
jgi:ABC-2 type transport system permease protein